jgi:hypothetical protein
MTRLLEQSGHSLQLTTMGLRGMSQGCTTGGRTAAPGSVLFQRNKLVTLLPKMEVQERGTAGNSLSGAQGEASALVRSS